MKSVRVVRGTIIAYRRRKSAGLYGCPARGLRWVLSLFVKGEKTCVLRLCCFVSRFVRFLRLVFGCCGPFAVFLLLVCFPQTFGRCLGSDAFHMTRLTVVSTCCVVVRLVGWFVVVCVVVRRASCRFHLCFIGCVVGICVCIGCVLRQFPRATRARHTCDICAAQVRRTCDTGAAHVRPMCDHHATHVRPMCDHHATHVRHMCDPCATTMQLTLSTKPVALVHKLSSSCVQRTRAVCHD